MLKKFVDGLVFGSGFAIAFVIVWTIWMSFVMSHLITSFTTQAEPPEFRNPREAKVATPSPSTLQESKQFSFFNHSGTQMEIPAGGGILSMAPATTTSGSKRPSTYQLWLTETKLWQIRTAEDKAEVEELPYPKDAGARDLEKLMIEKFGYAQSTMTISAHDISTFRATGSSSRDKTLNGTLKISTEGVVFVIPNPYDT